jgi:hypothetical protein
LMLSYFLWFLYFKVFYIQTKGFFCLNILVIYFSNLVSDLF